MKKKLPRKRKASVYEYAQICPDTNAGIVALHEDLANGWMFYFAWQESKSDGKGWINCIMLRRKK